MIMKRNMEIARQLLVGERPTVEELAKALDDAYERGRREADYRRIEQETAHLRPIAWRVP